MTLVLNDFVVRLRAALPEQKPQPSSVIATVDPDQLKSLIQDMIANLNNFDPAAGELFDAHRDVFQSFFTPRTFDTFEKQMNSFAFADAIVSIATSGQSKRVFRYDNGTIVKSVVES